MRFAWDAKKAAANAAKHSVDFNEASSVLQHALSLTNPDPDHSRWEHRFITFGLSARGRLLCVVHTEERDVVRIISARLATRRERRDYEQS